jgi:hypothetical protein
MSLVAEEIARREAELMENQGEVPVRVRVYRDGDLRFPHPDGDEEVKAIFKIMTFGDHLLIEQSCRHEGEREDGKTQIEIDFNEVRRLTLKRNLLSWSLDVPVERTNGWITPQCYENHVGKVEAPLVEALLDGFWNRSEISSKEESIISRQSSILFGKNSRGVTDACEAVRLYCTMTSQWEKFGIKEDELANMPYRKYLMLRMMSSNEAEATRRNSAPRNQATTRIAGKGGRTRASQGQRIPL